MLLFIVASAGWGFFFLTDTIEMWHAMLLLVIHGCAGVLWQTPNQLLLYDLVPQAALPSAVRLNATARYLGILVGPAVGGVIMLTLGTSHGIIFNTLFYLPMLLWLFWAPVRDTSVAVHRYAVRGFADIVLTIRAIGTQPILAAMTWLAGLTSFMIGNAYHAQMPGYAGDLGHGDPGVSYSVLLAADAGGALLAGLALEAWGRLRPTPRTAITLAILWSVALLAFATVRIYPLAIVLLFCRRLLRAVVQHHGAGAGAAERARRHPRPCRRPLQHGGPWHARLQRHHGRAGWRCDRHSLVARRFGRGAAGAAASCCTSARPDPCERITEPARLTSAGSPPQVHPGCWGDEALRNRWGILAILFFVRLTIAFQFQSVAAVAPLLEKSFGVEPCRYRHPDRAVLHAGRGAGAAGRRDRPQVRRQAHHRSQRCC